MKSFRAMVWMCLSLPLASCTLGPGKTADPAPTWRHHGDTLEFLASEPPPSIRVATVSAPATRFATLAGRLGWNDEATARVFTPVNGRIEHIEVEPGARVRRGQALVRMTSSDFGQVQAEASKAAADATAAERSYERSRDLLADGVIARKDFEQAEADWQRAQAETARAHTRLHDLGERRTTVDGSFELRSPLDGIVVERAVNAGTEVRSDATNPLFVITDPHKLMLLLDVPEDVAAVINVDKDVTFTVSTAPDTGGSAHLSHVSLAVDPLTRTVHARGVVMASHGAALRADAFVQARVPLSGAATLQVPASAVILVGNQQCLFIAHGNQYQRRPVTVSAQTPEFVQIAGGLQPDDTIVVEGALYLEQLIESDAPV